MDDLTERLVARAPSRARPAVELAVRTVVDAFDDRVPGLSAEMAFYLLLSLPPLLVTVFAAIALLGSAFAGFDPVAEASTQLDTLGRTFLTEQAAADLADILTNVQRVVGDRGTAILGFGLLTTVFSASRALRVTTVAITIAYDLEQTRPGWQQALYGLALTLGGLVVAVTLVPLLLAGPDLGSLLAQPLGLGAEFSRAWEVGYWPLAAVVATAMLAVLYHVAAPWWTPWRRDLPGAVLAMLIGLAGSSGLRLYAMRAIGGDESVFGPLAAPLVLLLWFYIVSFAVLLGAELNAEIERMWPTVHPDQPVVHERERLERSRSERVTPDPRSAG